MPVFRRSDRRAESSSRLKPARRAAVPARFTGLEFLARPFDGRAAGRAICWPLLALILLILFATGCSPLATGADIPPLALRDIAGTLSRWTWPLLLATLLLFLPGYSLQRALLPQANLDTPSRLALALSLSLMALPLFLLWTTTLGLRLSPFWAKALLLVPAALLTAEVQRARRNHHVNTLRSLHLCGAIPDPYTLALGGILALTLAVRCTQIRDLALPPWVDSVHHALIARLIAEEGKLASSYWPFLPVEAFTRHFGFNALVAWFHWLSGVGVPQAILLLGQLLNALSILPVYALTVRLTGQRLAGMIAGLMTGLISIMPAYYVSWGRYTHLSGMVILPVALLILMDALDRPQRDLRHLALTGIATTGLFLNHYRVFVFYLCFALVYLLHETALTLPSPRGRGTGGEGFPPPVGEGLRVRAATLRFTQGDIGADRSLPAEKWQRAFIIAGIALLLALPWLVNLWRDTILPLETFVSRMRSDAEYSTAPWDLLEAGQGRILIKLSQAALLWAVLKPLALAIHEPSRKRGAFGKVRAIGGSFLLYLAQQKAPFLILLWAVAVGLTFNPHLVGLQDTWLLSNSSAIISLYLPMSILSSYLMADWLSAPLAILSPRQGRMYQYILGALLFLVGLWGARRMVTVINPDTILATQEDVVAMDWIRQNVPPQAKFLINTAHWQREIYMGTDGGWWIPILTDRQTTLPAILYRAGTPEYIAEVNEFARWASQVPSLDDPEALRRLREAGVTHVYIGARGGHLSPQMLAGSPHFRVIYSSGAVWIYELVTTKDTKITE